MSHPRLNKCFRPVFGCSAFEFLRKKRLELSKELVAANDLSMTSIAYTLGYSGSSHFARAFFNHYGIQPSQYRKNYFLKTEIHNRQKFYPACGNKIDQTDLNPF